ncbi:hypothetical protein PR048_009550 [Dryococelus australis]|uniref:Uncharacterized protein n=1 Tax=Dryococelus australis TaxID=614101 RepID=A0ABQ9I0A9_9NEOP|nr:hypothetical protein PR048_009550 [Dryococelus australis]
MHTKFLPPALHLLYCDTDSLVYAVLRGLIHLTIRSITHKNKGCTRGMKDECASRIITQFVALCCKFYAYIVANEQYMHMTKGVKSNVLQSLRRVPKTEERWNALTDEKSSTPRKTHQLSHRSRRFPRAKISTSLSQGQNPQHQGGQMASLFSLHVPFKACGKAPCILSHAAHVADCRPRVLSITTLWPQKQEELQSDCAAVITGNVLFVSTLYIHPPPSSSSSDISITPAARKTMNELSGQMNGTFCIFVHGRAVADISCRRAGRAVQTDREQASMEVYQQDLWNAHSTSRDRRIDGRLKDATDYCEASRIIVCSRSWSVVDRPSGGVALRRLGRGSSTLGGGKLLPTPPGPTHQIASTIRVRPRTLMAD